MFSKINKEIKNFSVQFKLALCAMFFVYLACWFFTVYLSVFQVANKISPVLPVVPQDSEEYRDLANSIIQNHSFATSDGQISTLRSPGYPFFAAILKYATGSFFTVTLVQIFLVFCVAIFIRKLGALFHSVKAGEIAAILFVLDPLVLTLSLVILTDILFLFMFILGFYFAFSAGNNKTRIIGASVLFALAIYMRPMGVFALPIFAVPFLVSGVTWRQKIKSIVAMIFVVLVAVSPWVYRNYKLTGVADFSSFKAINLADYAVPMFLSNRNHTTIEEERANLEKEIGLPGSDWVNLRYSAQVSGFAEKIILEHPFAYMKYHISASLPFIFSSSIQDASDTYKSAMHIAIKSEPGAINYLVSRNWKLFFESVTTVWWKIAERIFLVVVCAVVLWIIWKERKRKITWAFVFVPAYLMLLAGPAANARYAIQALPFVLIMFSVGLLNIKEKIKSRFFTK